LINYIRPREMG